jgi:hypothetical protein
MCARTILFLDLWVGLNKTTPLWGKFDDLPLFANGKEALHLGVVFGSRMSASLGHSKEKRLFTSSVVSKQEL